MSRIIPQEEQRPVMMAVMVFWAVLTVAALAVLVSSRISERNLARRVCEEYPNFKLDRELFEKHAYPYDFIRSKAEQIGSPRYDDLKPFMVGWKSRTEEQSPKGNFVAGARYSFDYPPWETTEVYLSFDTTTGTLLSIDEAGISIDISCK